MGGFLRFLRTGNILTERPAAGVLSYFIIKIISIIFTLHIFSYSPAPKRGHQKNGIAHGGNPINLALLRNMITNPIYIGKHRYQGKVYDAEHDGICLPCLPER